MNWLKANPVFRFTSSVRLAIPLMLCLGAIVAWGTIVESQYNSDYAKLKVYNSTWFLILLILLFINILNSTLSRLPWKRRHLGFLVTHLGMLTLLTGAFVTDFYGVDGQLRVHEGEANQTLVLPRLMLSYRMEGSPRAQSVIFDKILSAREGSQLDFINDKIGFTLRAERLLPFAGLEKTFVKSDLNTDEVALSFVMKSQFFNVNEWLHSKDNPEMQLGPATLRLVKGKPAAREVSAVRVAKVETTLEKKPARVKAAGGDVVLIKDKSTGATVAKWDLKKPTFVFKDLNLTLKRRLGHAVVAENRLVEGDGPPGTNPALEVEAHAGAKTLREILFAKYPNFSLNKAGLFGYALQFNAGNAPAEAPPAPDVAASNPHGAGGAGMMAAAGAVSGAHVIEFRVDPDHPAQAQIELFKDGKSVGRKLVQEGETFTTPWMGMTVALGTISWGTVASYQARPIEPQRGQELPPSAIFVKALGPTATGFWLAEGDVKMAELNGRRAEVYFGRETLELPFSVHLNKFTKTDYPGTETPLSYESEVDLGDGIPRRIAMNEPVKRDGFTVYQASYVMNENGPPDSVFSVNRDPGRPIKYGGSLILACGIILFTVSRSRWYQRRFGPL